MQLADETGLYLQRGKMLFELRPGHAGKGSAVTHLLKATELGGGLPIFIGDDVTDEEGFLAATRHNGAGILAGAPRPTAALYRLEGVAAVRGWLSECRERRSEEHTSELQSLMRTSYAVFCLKKKTKQQQKN